MRNFTTTIEKNAAWNNGRKQKPSMRREIFVGSFFRRGRELAWPTARECFKALAATAATNRAATQTKQQQETETMSSSLASLAERWRPVSFDEVVGQDKVVKQIVRMRDATGLAGRAYWISGQSGQGKTTIAKLIAAEVADDMNIATYNATDFGLSEARQTVRSMRTYGLGTKNGRAVIVNEAHALRNDVLVYLDDALEPISHHACWIFTTTREGQKELFADHFDAGPVLSRCINLSLASRNLAQAFAARARMIAQAEQLDGRPMGQYIELVKQKRNNLRAVLMAIEAGEMLD